MQVMMLSNRFSFIELGLKFDLKLKELNPHPDSQDIICLSIIAHPFR